MQINTSKKGREENLQFFPNNKVQTENAPSAPVGGPSQQIEPQISNGGVNQAVGYKSKFENFSVISSDSNPGKPL